MASVAGCASEVQRDSSPSTSSARVLSEAVLDEEDAAYKIDDCLACNFWPGVYETDGPTTTLCQWFRSTGLAPDGKEIASGFIHQGGGQVDLYSGDYFSFRGCKPFRFVRTGHQ